MEMENGAAAAAPFFIIPSFPVPAAFIMARGRPIKTALRDEIPFSLCVVMHSHQ